MKLLVVCGSIDLKYRFATTLYYWQLLKGLYENGVDVIVIPYMGFPVESLWWRTYSNPCAIESLAVNYVMDKFTIRSASKKGASSILLDKYIKPKWEKHLLNILRKEQNIDAIVYLGVPINHLKSIPNRIKKEFRVPFLHFDGDLPGSLPQFIDEGSYKFNSYNDADLSEFDVILSNAICADEPLKELGAKIIKRLNYGVDTDVCYPLNIEKNIDIFYSGIRATQKEKQIEYMVGEPSLKTNYKFVIGGDTTNVIIGKAVKIPIVPTNEWQRYICRSKIALNITKKSSAKHYGSTSMRPFELASMGSCVVSDVYNGLSEWFEVGKEMFVVNNASEALELYKTLLSDDELRIKTGKLARERVIKDHSTKIRAKQLMGYVNEAKTLYNSK